MRFIDRPKPPKPKCWRWFAWRPVHVNEGGWCWLQWVYKHPLYDEPFGFDGPIFQVYFYTLTEWYKNK